MHFHLPKPLHGWRAFVGEVGIIVLGVLIALSAEQFVDTLRWHEKARGAEAAMRLELSGDDGPQAYGRLLIGACLDEQLTRIHDGLGHVPPNELRQWIASYAPPFRTWDSEAWKAVVASDVGSHMSPDRLIRWSSPYRIMPMLSEHNIQESDLSSELHEALPPSGNPSMEEVDAARRLTGHLRMLNRRLMRGSQLVLARSAQNGALLPVSVRNSLLSQARIIYGGCVHAPDLSAIPEAQNLDANLHAGSVR